MHVLLLLLLYLLLPQKVLASHFHLQVFHQQLARFAVPSQSVNKE